MCLWQEHHRSDMSFSVHLIRELCTDNVTWITCLRWCLPCFSTVNILFSSSTAQDLKGRWWCQSRVYGRNQEPGSEAAAVSRWHLLFPQVLLSLFIFALRLHFSATLKNCLSQLLHAHYERLPLSNGGLRPQVYMKPSELASILRSFSKFLGEEAYDRPAWVRPSPGSSALIRGVGSHCCWDLSLSEMGQSSDKGMTRAGRHLPKVSSACTPPPPHCLSSPTSPHPPPPPCFFPDATDTFLKTFVS